MNPAETLKALGDFISAQHPLQAATVAEPADDGEIPETRSLNLAADAEQFFRGTIGTSVGIKLNPLGWVLRDYDPLYKPDSGEIEVIELAQVPALALATSRLDELAPLAAFDGADDAYIRRLSYWGLALNGPDGNTAYFFRGFHGAAELKRKRGAALTFKAGTFHNVEERIFLFAEGIDCFVFGEYAFVIQKNRFRKLFDQMEEIYKRATEAAAELHARLPIANFEAFEAACSTDAALADKVLAVRGRDYFDQLCYEFVAPVIAEFNLQIPTVTGPDGKTQLEFRLQPGHRHRILKLLDDDFLRSSMTEHRYEVNSKTEPSGA
jgi:hypothetical protein